MVKWKDTQGVKSEQIKQVVEARTAATANRLLKERWILLDVKAVQLGNKEGEMKGGAHYVFGRKNAI